jgi:ABC-type enterochelin transport system substrate-binding protein
VFVVQMRALIESYEELTAVGGFSTVGHAHQTGGIHGAPTQILIFKVAAVDAVAACAVAASYVSALYHEFVNDAMEGTEGIAEILVRACT